MKPESAKFIDQANIVLARADLMLTVNLNEDAARAAYLASFHVAQATSSNARARRQNRIAVSRLNFSASRRTMRASIRSCGVSSRKPLNSSRSPTI